MCGRLKRGDRDLSSLNRTSPHPKIGTLAGGRDGGRMPSGGKHRPLRKTRERSPRPVDGTSPQPKAELRFPPFAHRASVCRDRRVVDEAWKTRRRWSRGRNARLREPALCRASQGAFSTGCPRTRSPRQAQRRWAGGGKRGAGSSETVLGYDDTRVGPCPVRRGTSPLSTRQARRRLRRRRGRRRKGTWPVSEPGNVRRDRRRKHRPNQGGVAFSTLRPPRLRFVWGPAPWTKRGKRAACGVLFEVGRRDGSRGMAARRANIAPFIRRGIVPRTACVNGN